MRVKLLSYLVGHITREWNKHYPSRPVVTISDRFVFRGYWDIVANFWGLSEDEVSPYLLNHYFWTQPVVMLLDCIPDFLEEQLSGQHEKVVLLKIPGGTFSALELCAEGGFHTLVILRADALELNLDVAYTVNPGIRRA